MKYLNKFISYVESGDVENDIDIFFDTVANKFAWTAIIIGVLYTIYTIVRAIITGSL